jgi:hypothetical protein
VWGELPTCLPAGRGPGSTAYRSQSKIVLLGFPVSPPKETFAQTYFQEKMKD